MRHTIAILFIAFLTSCGSETTDPFSPEYEGEPLATLFQQLYNPIIDSTLFQGLNLGNILNIDSLYPDAVLEQDTWGAVYEQHLSLLLPDSPDSIDAYFRYCCEGGYLYRIEVDIRSGSKGRCDSLWSILKTNLDQQYTVSPAESDYAVWTVNPTGKKAVEVSLSNYPTEYEQPRLVLHFMNPARSRF
jgi:hypothetical protein